MSKNSPHLILSLRSQLSQPQSTQLKSRSLRYAGLKELNGRIYTIILQKTRKVAPADEPVISNSYKIGEAGKVVLTIDNQSSKKKKLLYRSKTKPCSD